MSTLEADKGFVDKAREFQHRVESRQQRFGKGKYGRVLKMARKPTSEEFGKTTKITGLGILLVGFIGFIIFMVKSIAIPAILKAFGH